MKLCVLTDSAGNHRLLIIMTDDTRHLISITADEYRALLAGEIRVTTVETAKAEAQADALNMKRPRDWPR